MHELHGGNPELLHPVMMRQGLVGLDVLTVAVHFDRGNAGRDIS